MDYDKIWDIKNVLFSGYIYVFVMVYFNKLLIRKVIFDFRYLWFDKMVVFVLVGSKEKYIFFSFYVVC